MKDVQKVWQKYLSEYNRKIKNCYFRNKDSGWNCFSMKIVLENNKYIIPNKILPS